MPEPRPGGDAGASSPSLAAPMGEQELPFHSSLLPNVSGAAKSQHLLPDPHSQPHAGARRHRAAPHGAHSGGQELLHRSGLLLTAQQQHLLHPTPLPKPCRRTTGIGDGNSEPSWGLSLPCRSEEGQGDGHWSSQGHTAAKAAPAQGYFPDSLTSTEEQVAVQPHACSCPLHHCSQLNPDGAKHWGICWEAAMELAVQHTPRGAFVSFSTEGGQGGI